MSPEARRLWGWPIVLGVLTASGLVSALVSDGGGDFWSWFALGVPVAVMAQRGLRRQPGLRAEPAPKARAGGATTPSSAEGRSP